MSTYSRTQFFILLAAYTALRTFSFFLINHTRVAAAIALLLIASFAYVCIRDIRLAWKILVLELVLDGAGHFFELHGLILRTWLLGIFAIVWIAQKIRARSKIVWPNKNMLIGLGAFGVVLAWAMVNGFLNHHARGYVVQDTILYLFLALLFPALEFENGWNKLYATALEVFIYGTALFSAFTLALYSLGISVLQDPYYHWFRDIAAGKITDLGSHFFRIVTAEQILFVPIALVLFTRLTQNLRDKKTWALFACTLFVLILNFTRIYFVGLAVGALVLLRGTPFKIWVQTGIATLATAALIFFGTHLVASRGTSLGLELIGVRVGRAIAPTDQSAAIRAALLPDIKRIISAHPLIGNGLGTEVSYNDPTTHETKTRTQFDWGYFEMIAELGAIGTLTYLALLITIIYNFARTHEGVIARALVAGAVALFVINITTPALFQGFGVIYFAFLVL